MATASAEGTAKSAMTGSAVEALAGTGAVVLAIMELADVGRYGMAGAAAITVGAALVLQGSATLARLRAVPRRGACEERAQICGPACVAILSGVGGTALGALSLADIAPLAMLALAAIVFGGATMLASIGAARVHTLGEGPSGVRAASGFELVAGVAAATLGILALIGFAPLVLCSIALLTVGATLLRSGTAIKAMMRRHADRAQREAGPQHRHA